MANEGVLTCTDNLVPNAPRDDYTLTVEQSVTENGTTHTFDKVEKTLTVTGVRFGLAESEIHAVHPAPASTGDVTGLLPHVALERRVLPWETRLSWQDDALDDAKIPWLALLLFAADELPGDPAALGVVERGTVEQRLCGQEKGLVQPALGSLTAEEKAQDVRTITVGKDVFAALMPKPAELPFLAHVRSPLPGARPTGAFGPEQADRREAEFAFVMANRVPVPGRHVAHLVSLEGHTASIRKPDAMTGEKIRLVSLCGWSFTCLPEAAYLFADLRAGLTRPGETGGGRALLLRRPDPPPEAGDDPYLLHMRYRLERGFVPLSHHRIREHTYAWYRGPFIPHEEKHLARPSGWKTAASYRAADGDYGVDEVGRAAAWSLGRGLGLADEAFAQAVAACLARLRTGHQRSAHLYHPPAGPLGRAAWTAQVARYAHVPDDLNRQEFDLLLADHGWDVLLAAALGAPAAEPTGAGHSPALPAGDEPPPDPAKCAAVHELVCAGSFMSPSAVPDVFTNLTRQLADPDVTDAVLTAVQAEDIGAPDLECRTPQQQATPWCRLAAWLDRLRALDGVPFDHLVPDAAMLPAESLRFFHLDRNWLDALTDGALSIAACSVSDENLADALRTDYYAKAAAVPAAGIILRSALASRYPKLEVAAYGSDGSPVMVRRRLTPAPDVLVCLFSAVPAEVVLTEPFQGLHLGTTIKTQGQTKLHCVGIRSLVKKKSFDLGQSMPDRWVQVPFRQGSGTAATVIDLGGPDSGLVKRLTDELTRDDDSYLPQGGFTPAGLALQMVRAPERATLRLAADTPRAGR
ncbi:hypothetical protein AB0J52_08000 [Spirillospora sp. NPDC049652]